MKPAALAIALCIGAACGKTTDPETALRRGQFADAIDLLLPLAEQGDADAQYSLGVLHYMGSGTARDYSKALQWFERAALTGHSRAQRSLGSMFRQGLGTPKDDFRAFGWYDAAFRAGDKSAHGYMEWTALVVGANQQALGRRLIAKDLKEQKVSHGSTATGYR